MLNRLFHLILIVTIFSCPLRCQLDQCGCAGSERLSGAVDSCDCCDTTSDPVSFPNPDQPCSQCQCVCSGATLPDHFVLDGSGERLSEGFSCQQATFEIEFFIPMKTGPLDYAVRPPAANRGRSIRCWFNSLII